MSFIHLQSISSEEKVNIIPSDGNGQREEVRYIYEEELKIMTKMECSDIQLLNFPDEILMTILKKLNNVEVLYSLMNVNMRLNQIVCDSTFTSEISLMEVDSSFNLTSSLSDVVLDRFCLEILPKIHDKIQWIKVETSSMERVLRAAKNYPNLHQLDIFIRNRNVDMHFFTGKIFQSFPLMKIFC